MKDKVAFGIAGASGPDQSSSGLCGHKASQPDAMQLDAAAAAGDWISSATLLAQEIATAMQQDANDTEPLSDAPSHEALCTRAQLICQQACAASSDISALSQQHMQGLQQVSSSTMQLATAMLCDPTVACQLIAAGTYAAAADQVKSGIKQICSYLLECLKAGAAAAAAPEAASQQQQQQAALEGLLPAVQAVVLHLLDIALTQAAFISGLQPQHRPLSNTQVPKELRSMAVLNLSWGNLCKLLLETPPQHRPAVLQPQQLQQGLQCALQQLLLAIQGPQPSDKRGVLARFWLQNAQRLVTVAGPEAAGAVLELLLAATVDVYAYAQGDDVDMHAFLEQQLQPRLITCLAVLLSCTPGDQAATQIKLDLLLRMPSSLQDSPEQQQQQLLLQAHLLAILDLMQHLHTMPAEVVHLCCQQLMLRVVRTAGSSLCSSILAHGPAGSALLQHVLQCCLLCYVGCADLLGPQHQQDLLGAITLLAFDQHPVVAHIARQHLAEVLACSSIEAVQQQLAAVMELLESAAACSAVPGGNKGTAMAAAEAALCTVVAILQAQDETTASSWAEQHILNAPPFNNSNGSWLDPSSCALLMQQCSLLLQLWPTAAAVNQPQLEDSLNQLWLTAQQVVELLDVHHWQQQQQQQQQSSLSEPAAAEQLLVLHQLTWQLQAMQGLMQLLSAKLDAESDGGKQAQNAAEPWPSSIIQSCTAFAVEVLKSITNPSSTQAATNPSGSSSSNSPTTTAAAQAACSAAALKVLAATAHVAVAPASRDKLLQVLQAVAEQQHGLHHLLASIVGKIRTAGEDQRHEALFQLLLLSPHWPVRHAALEGLILHLQYNNFAKTGIPKLLPGNMKVSPTEAKPEAIEVIKSYLHKRPDSQAQAAYEANYVQLADHVSSTLVALNNSSSSSTGDSSSSSSGRSWKCIAAELAQLEELVTASGLQMGYGPVGSSKCNAALQTLMQLATAAGCSLEAVEQAVFKAESEVQQLMSAATAAAQEQQLSSDEVMLISRKGSSMVGSCASLCSRLRALQDRLSRLKS